MQQLKESLIFQVTLSQHIVTQEIDSGAILSYILRSINLILEIFNNKVATDKYYKRSNHILRILWLNFMLV